MDRRMTFEPLEFPLEFLDLPPSLEDTLKDLTYRPSFADMGVPAEYFGPVDEPAEDADDG